MQQLQKVNNQAVEYILNKNYKKAEKLLIKNIGLNSSEIHINLASVYQLTKRPALAILHFIKALSISEKYPQVYSKLINQKYHICDWNGLDKFHKLANKYYTYESPFSSVIRVDNPKINYLVAKNARPGRII
jgi:tetratricopeptide (TPR) repeat protein